MNSEHKIIEEMIFSKIKSINDSNLDLESKTREMKKYETLNELINNPFHPFFDKMSTEIAFNILRDIGVDSKDLRKTYLELIREENGKKYVLVDLDLGEKKPIF